MFYMQSLQLQNFILVINIYMFVCVCVREPVRVASKLFSLAMQGSGALLSSNLEGALYKSP